MTRKALMKKAQTVFNAWIRERDKDRGCISCTTGGVHNAGHYYHSHLYSNVRFSEINTNGQCVPCNLGKAGNPERYRENMIKRWGDANVNLLDISARKKKTWTIFELELIIKNYAGNN